MEIIESLAELQQRVTSSAGLLAHRRALEDRLAKALPEGQEGVFVGHCRVCGKPSRFEYKRSPGDCTRINWRESLVCIGAAPTFLGSLFGRSSRGCKLNSRQRLAVDLLCRTVSDLSTASVYLTEQLSPSAMLLGARCKRLVTSEFLGPNVPGGMVDARGVRHEDLTKLSFTSHSFDAVLSLDVLEHIPDYRSALSEMRRVLKPGGQLILTVPFALDSRVNIRRAVVRSDGNIEHLVQPEYHGDPLKPNEGILCFHTFGWKLLDDLKSVGFTNANVHLAWSSKYGYIGPEQPLIVAKA